MSKAPCACPACNGRLVTKYVWQNHMRTFVALNATDEQGFDFNNEKIKDHQVLAVANLCK